MSTNKTLHGGEKLQHGDEAAALPPPPEAHPVGALTEPLRQADEPPSEATQSPNPRQPDGPAGTAGVMTHHHHAQQDPTYYYESLHMICNQAHSQKRNAEALANYLQQSYAPVDEGECAVGKALRHGADLLGVGGGSVAVQRALVHTLQDSSGAEERE